jgi:phosphatidylglycerol---prolipoprotein diacylglyceryl transferase
MIMNLGQSYLISSLPLTRKIAIGLLVFVIVCVIFFFEPVQTIFAGNAKLEQQLSIPLADGIPLISQFIGKSLNIRFYSICVLLGILSGYVLTLGIAKLHFIAATVIDRLLIGLVIFGLIGARMLYVLVNYRQFVLDPISVFYSWLGGLAFFGALLAGLLYLVIYCNRFKFNIFEFLDVLTPGLLIGQIFGRFGNFFNYESYGGPTSVFWKMYIPETAKISSNINQDYFHPTFLYEIGPNTLLLVLLLWVYPQLTNKKSGVVFAMYCIGYGCIRAVTELFRLDALVVTLFNVDLRISQILSVALIITGIVILLVRNKVVYSKRTMIEINQGNKTVSII